MELHTTASGADGHTLVMVGPGAYGDTRMWWSRYFDSQGQWGPQQPFTDRQCNVSVPVSLLG